MVEKIVSLSTLVVFVTITLVIDVYGQTDSLDVVAELDIRPGNVAISNSNRVFATVHPLGNPSVQLIEIT